MKLLAAIFAMGVLLVGHLAAGQFGTGFAINPKGYLVTCHHVIRNAERIHVHTQEGILPAQIVALDPHNDIAILKVDGWRGRFLGLGMSGDVTHGSSVMAAGFPDPSILGRNPKVSKGSINALSGVLDDPRYLQMSAPVQPGNSGGPLISATGHVVGIVAAGLNSMDRMAQGGYLPQSVNFAIKTDLIFPLLKTASISTPRFGTGTRNPSRQIERALNSIALVEGVQKSTSIQAPAPRPQQRNPLPAPVPPPVTDNRRGPWVFPNSHQRALRPVELQNLSSESLWRARNEIYLRHGFVFSTAQGQHFASQFGSAYRPVTPSIAAVQQSLSPVEIANLNLIASFEAARNS
ncbi:MAG: hypothetical protein CMO55_02340 [Verrucomicrobiales bacterium]|nr:hypothetical protein [Verrucomicrobiales bacterium]